MKFYDMSDVCCASEYKLLVLYTIVFIINYNSLPKHPKTRWKSSPQIRNGSTSDSAFN